MLLLVDDDGGARYAEAAEAAASLSGRRHTGYYAGTLKPVGPTPPNPPRHLHRPGAGKVRSPNEDKREKDVGVVADRRPPHLNPTRRPQAAWTHQIRRRRNSMCVWEGDIRHDKGSREGDRTTLREPAIISTRRPSSSHAREAFARASRPSNAQGLGKAVAVVVVVVVVVWAPHPYGEARARSRGARGWYKKKRKGKEKRKEKGERRKEEGVVVATRAAAAAAAVTASPAAVPSTLSFDSFPPGPPSFTRC
uniref:Uncharacterized protein n=1 Tax=Ananas comosus var. bracteatus TaxID=296719 RepID=A0A6V7QTA9_ANACO